MKKINDYQKVILIWGIALFVAYFLTEQHLANLPNLLLIWTVAYSVAFFFQVYYMWYNNRPVYLAQATWIIVSLMGGIFTYFKVVNIVKHPFNITTMWFAAVALGMFITGVTQRNKSYYLLVILYFISAAVFQLVPIPYEYRASGVVFLVLAFVDFFMEWSPLRKNLADFETNPKV